jgi:hypothetical protein
MPGYLAMYHNALWVSLANGACATPFWWSYSDRINDSVVTNQLLHFARFVADIDFAASAFKPVTVTAGDCDAWALQSDKMVFGWIVHPRTSVANENFTIAGLPDASYTVRLYRTWRGSYLDPLSATARDGKLTVSIPELRTSRGHASHIGHDIAFRIEAAAK